MDSISAPNAKPEAYLRGAEGSVSSNRFVCQSASMMPSCDRFLPVADCFLPVAASSVCDGEINGFGNETPHKNCHSALAAGSADCIPTAGPQDDFRPTMFCHLAGRILNSCTPSTRSTRRLDDSLDDLYNEERYLGIRRVHDERPGKPGKGHVI